MAIENVLTLTPELAEDLQKLADAEKLTLLKLIEVMTERYKVERMAESNQVDTLTKEEITVLKASVEEAKRPGAKWHSTEQLLASLNSMTDADYKEDDEGLEWRM